MNIQSKTFRVVIILLLLALCGGLYSFGVSPLFILDDEPSLSGLAQVKQHHNVLAFIQDGTAGPLGRPISLLSFALQADAYPDATPFKYINIAIHLLIGGLIYSLLMLIGRLLKWSLEKAFWISFFSTLIWLISPIQVSTALYVVQRMAQLSIFFIVLGLIFYLKAREWLVQEKNLKGYLTASLGISLCGLLALFSKENGVLIILYLWVLEATLLQHLPKPRFWLYWKTAFIYLPIIIIVSYFAITIHPEKDYSYRLFSLTERLLSESRILLSYLGNIFLPGYFMKFNLFQDDYLISKDILTPISTLWSVITIISSFSLALWLRKTAPILAFGILWFFAGHALESTFIPLVLYFEHRNYLALLGPVFSVVVGIFALLQKDSLTILFRKALLTLSIVWLLLISSATLFELSLWREPVLQSIYWAEQKPLSRYAQSHVSTMYLYIKQPEKAVEHYKHMIDVFPNDAAPYVFWLDVACEYPEIPAPEITAVYQRFNNVLDNDGAVTGIQSLLDTYTSGKCSRFSPEIIETILSSLWNNPKIRNSHGIVSLWYANWKAFRGEYVSALQKIDEALQYNVPKKDIAKLQKLGWLMELNAFEEALNYIKQLRHEFSLIQNSIHREHLDNMEKLATDFIISKNGNKQP
ncbi:MAG: hypothetical protein RIT27_2379 [Pseudomonadota bacterium]|jgi:tetratricopeptide (TPR) repeat protein